MRKLLFGLGILYALSVKAQPDIDTASWYHYHFQITSVYQQHNAFKSLYSGRNSQTDSADKALSLTTTIFFESKLWKWASAYFNPEIAGGRGVGATLGIAGFTNGECFRIGNPEPELYIARAFIRQYIPLSDKCYYAAEALNQIPEWVPEKRITITVGKFSIADMFDNNRYSHDPRLQFINWGLMSNGAWDYPANTRGYTYGLAIEYAQPEWGFRVASTLVPLVANGPDMDWNISKVHAETAELQRNYRINEKKGLVKVLAFRNVSRAGNYTDAIALFNKTKDSSALNINTLTAYNGSVKYGYGLNVEQELMGNIGFFARYSHNDGQTATWAFTEIDDHYSAGLSISGNSWKRPDDVIGFAMVVNGISAEHRAFLNAGGYGFIIGDGALTHYGQEFIAESYYSMKLKEGLYISADYQFVQNPAYNKDRGPIQLWALRAHVEF